MKAVLLVSHGSHSKETKEEVSRLVGRLQAKVKNQIIKYAFLEIESPSIPEGIKACVNEEAKTIVILLNFLNSGKHVDVDIPRIVQEAQSQYPQVRFTITKPVGQHEKILELFLNLIP